MNGRFHLLGMGAMNSPRYRPAGLVITYGRAVVMVDGGPGSEPSGRIDAWLVCDEKAELRREIRALARAHGVEARVGPFVHGRLVIDPLPVEHTSHPTFGYQVTTGTQRVVWAPEFFRFPAWAEGADLMFADAAGWSRPILFAGGVGGHAAVLDTAERARASGVRRLVFAHVGRPTIRAIDLGEHPPFGEIGVEGATYY